MTNTQSLIFGSLGVLGVYNGLGTLIRLLEPKFDITYYPLELDSTTLKASFFLVFGIIALTVVLLYEIQERQKQV